jgi:DNA-binding MarR family transcriptional regulator
MRSIDRDARALHARFLALARRRSLRDPVAASCEALGLGPPQIHALLWLGHDGPLTMGELARRVSVTEKTVTGLVDRLARGGYLRREGDAADRRIVRARVTARGAEASRVIEAGVHEGLVRLLGLLSAGDRRALLGILDRLDRRLEEPPEAVRKRPPSGRRPKTRHLDYAGPSQGGRREAT